MNNHLFVPSSEYEICYDENHDRFLHLGQSIMIAGLLLIIGLQSSGKFSILAWSWFGFGVASVVDEVLFQNQGGYKFEFLIFVLISTITYVEYRIRTKREAQPDKTP